MMAIMQRSKRERTKYITYHAGVHHARSSRIKTRSRSTGSRVTIDCRDQPADDRPVIIVINGTLLRYVRLNA